MKKLSCLFAATFALATFSVAGHTAPGDLAGSYATGGLFLQEAPEPGGPITDLVVEADGSVVAATGPNFTLARFTPAGTRDTTFGNAGVASINGVGNLAALTRQADGKYVAVGREKVSTYNFNFVILRFNADGTPDTSFDGDGKVLFSIANGDYLDAVVAETNGAIVAAGWSGASGATGATGLYPVLFRRTATGAADTTFGSPVSSTDPSLGRTGQVSMPLASMLPATSARWRALLRDTAGHFYVAGGVSNEENWTPLLARYTTSGDLDLTYGGDGWEKLELSTVANAHEDSGISAMIPAPDGGLFLGGRSQYDYVVYKLLPGEPMPDTNYANQGRAKINIAQSDGYYGVQIALQNNGKIVVAGASDFDHSATWDLHGTVVRLTSGGQIDNDFHQDGRVTIPLSEFGNNGFYAMGLRPDGDIIAGGARDGSADEGDQSLGALAWIEGDRAGNPDISCGAAGVAPRILEDAGWHYGRDVVAMPYNRFAVVASDGAYAVRYLSDGTRDMSYGGNGLAQGYASRALAAAAAGSKLVIAGGVATGASGMPPYDSVVTRLRYDGTLDTDFGDGGARIVTLSADGNDLLNAVMVLPDERILAAGTATIGNIHRFALLKLKKNGSRDDTFGDNGVVISYEAGEQAVAGDVALSVDGKYLVAGYGWSGRANELVLAQYTSTGELDAGFGVGGIVRTGLGGLNERAYAVKVQPLSGRILVAGESSGTIVVAGFESDGDIDPNWGVGGFSRINTGANSGLVYGDVDLDLQADGRVLVAGTSKAADGIGGFRALMARLTGDGDLDDSFGSGGVVLRDVAAGNDTDMLAAIAVRTSGGIVAVGSTDMQEPGSQMGVLTMCIHP